MSNQPSLIEKISLKVFWTCMILTASSFVFVIWFVYFTGKSDNDFELVYMVNATLFIIGFASFLVWLSNMLNRLINSKK